jgi:hypothetical protein
MTAAPERMADVERWPDMVALVRRAAFLPLVLLFAMVLGQSPEAFAADCGVERWSVKTGTDPDAALVDLASVTSATVEAMRSWPRPATLPSNNRLRPAETTIWVTDGTLTLYRRADDSDYHVVLEDSAGNTMITEIPSPSCVGPTSPFAEAIAFARTRFDHALSATSNFKAASMPVRVVGVGFFDFLHGQTGLAPNGIELHPVLDIIFNPGPHPLALNLTLNRRTAKPADFVQISISRTNTGAEITVDLYFVVVLPASAGPHLGCPEGDALGFLASLPMTFVIACASAPPQTFPAFARSVTIAAGTRALETDFLNATWPIGAPAGTYTFAVVATLPGALADGSINPGDLLTLAVDSLGASP